MNEDRQTRVQQLMDCLPVSLLDYVRIEECRRLIESRVDVDIRKERTAEALLGRRRLTRLQRVMTEMDVDTLAATQYTVTHRLDHEIRNVDPYSSLDSDASVAWTLEAQEEFEPQPAFLGVPGGASG